MFSFGGSCYIHRFYVKFVGYNFRELCIIAVFVINLHCFKMVCSTTCLPSLVLQVLLSNRKQKGSMALLLCCFKFLLCCFKFYKNFALVNAYFHGLSSYTLLGLYICSPYHKSMSAHVVTECKKLKKITRQPPLVPQAY